MEIEEKEKIEEIEISKEDLKKIILAAINTSQTIEEAISQKQQEDKNMQESFNMTKEVCSYIISYGNSCMTQINIVLLQAYLLKLFLSLKSGKEELFNGLISKMKNTKSDIKSQNALLREIKKAVLKLEKVKTASCNMEICELIAYIYEKQQLILDELVTYINICKLNVEGIEYQGVNKNQEKLAELDTNIDNSIKSLGLRK